MKKKTTTNNQSKNKWKIRKLKIMNSDLKNIMNTTK